MYLSRLLAGNLFAENLLKRINLIFILPTSPRFFTPRTCLDDEIAEKNTTFSQA